MNRIPLQNNNTHHRQTHTFSAQLRKSVRRWYCLEHKPPIVSLHESDLAEISTRLKQAHRFAIKDRKKAGVLLPLCCDPNGQPAVLFTLRSNKVGTHKGQVSFPGGRMDDTDKDIVECALRENEEEIGIPQSQVKILGIGNDALSITNLSVTPVIGYLGKVDPVQLKAISIHEIDEVFTLTMSELSNPKNISYVTYERRGTLPIFNVGKYPVWGLTAYILHNFMKNIMRIPFPSPPPTIHTNITATTTQPPTSSSTTTNPDPTAKL